MAKAAAKNTKPVPKAAGKPTQAVTTTTKKEVAKSNVDAALLREQVAGQGVSTDAADNIVPLVYTLQSQSPVCLKQKPEYIKGATAGMFWPRGSKDLWDGEEEGVRVVPCFFSKCWLEWMPDRGGFVGRHDKRPAEAEGIPDPKDPKRIVWTMPNGNTVQESREFACLVLGVGDKLFGEAIPAVFSFTGSDHTSARAWMSLCNRKRTPKGAKASLYEYTYLLKTVAKSNDKGDWYGKIAEDIDERTADEYFVMAHEVAKGFGGGTLSAGDHDVAEAGDGSSSTDSEDDDNI
jgi:hypothetical protein